jgi:peptide deformylase
VAILPIVKMGHEQLAKRAESVTDWGDWLQELVRDMNETMNAANGVGLAANQVGLPHDLAIIDVDPGTSESNLIVLTNPEIIETRGSVKEEEGCLSVPGMSAEVVRPEWVVARFQDAEGKEQTIESDGLLAKALVHEIDHLQGFLYLQRIKGMRGELVRRRARKMRDRGEWDDVYP